MRAPEAERAGRSGPLAGELRRGAPGVWAWLVQRVTALLLLVLVPLKIWSGYVFVGRAPGPRALAALHVDPLLDGLLLFAVIFHTLFGIRVMLIDLGLARHGLLLFRLAVALAAALSLAAVVLLR